MSTRAHTLPGRLLILLIALVATFLLLSGTGSASSPTITSSYRVQAGDSLWGIATTFTSPGDDVRASVDTVRELNSLDSSNISPGQVLVLPAG